MIWAAEAPRPAGEKHDSRSHGLVVAAQGGGYGRGMLALGTGQHNLAAADRKGLGRAKACFLRSPLVRRIRMHLGFGLSAKRVGHPHAIPSPRKHSEWRA